jgi:hypothetical protein
MSLAIRIVPRIVLRAAITSLILGALTACAEVKRSHSLESRMPSETANATAGSNIVRGPFGAELSARFDYAAASRIVTVRYTLRNSGDAPLAVFDRGDANSLAANQHALGEVGIPRMFVEGDDVTLEHVVLPLPENIDITSPPTPVALEVPPGASIDGRFEFALKGTVVPKRLRWCVGVMRVGDAYMESPLETKAGKLWSASFAVVEKQQRVCTPWYDVENARFEA